MSIITTNKYPYTDFHEMNADWLLEKFQELEAAMTELQAAVAENASDIEALTTRVTALENEIATFEATITATFTAKFDELQAALEAEVDAKIAEIEEELTNLQAQVEALIESFESRMQTIITEIQQQVDDKLDEITAEFDAFKTDIDIYIETRFEELIAQIPEFENVLVYSPYDDKHLYNIQDVIYQIHEYVRVKALQVKEIDDLGLTCSELDSYIVESRPTGLSAYEWDYKAKDIIYTDPRFHMYNQVSGVYNNIKDNIDINTTILRIAGAYTATELDSEMVDAESYDALTITAYEFDWYLNRKLA